MQAALNDEDYNTIALSGDVVAESEDVVLRVTRSVTIDLNGKKVDRNLNGYGGDPDGSVFDLDGDDEVGIEVTIKDSLGAGVITGGYTYNGGGININPGATLYFEGGAIQNNKAKN